MKKLLAIILVLTLSGCLQLQVESSIPETAYDVQSYFVDFDGDGTDEEVVYYKNIDFLGKGPSETEGEYLKEDVNVLREHLGEVTFANESYKVYPEPDEDGIGGKGMLGEDVRIIDSIEVVDIGLDGEEELFVIFDDTNFTLVGSEGEIEIPKSLTMTEGFSTSVSSNTISVKVENGKIVQNKGSYCEFVSDYCLTYDLVSGYEEIVKENYQKIEDKWAEYEELCPNACTTWDMITE